MNPQSNPSDPLWPYVHFFKYRLRFKLRLISITYLSSELGLSYTLASLKHFCEAVCSYSSLSSLGLITVNCRYSSTLNISSHSLTLWITQPVPDLWAALFKRRGFSLNESGFFLNTWKTYLWLLLIDLCPFVCVKGKRHKNSTLRENSKGAIAGNYLHLIRPQCPLQPQSSNYI